MSNQPQIAAANALSGERVTETTTFPITGDSETDAISGVIAALTTAQNSGNTPITPAIKSRILRYLAERFEAEAKELERQREEMNKISGRGAGYNPKGLGPGIFDYPPPPANFGTWYDSTHPHPQSNIALDSKAKMLADPMRGK